MKLRIIRDLSILILVFGAIWLVATIFFSGKEDTQLLPVEKEISLGDFFFENLSGDPEYRVIRNSYTDSCLTMLNKRLTDSLVSEYTYQTHIFDNSMVNAFALPGGHIMLSKGLIIQSENTEEVAAVLAHEIAHIEKKHLIGKLIKDLGLAILLSDDPFLIGEVSRSAASTAYDRKKEKEADEFALELMTSSKIDPRVLGVFFRKLKEADLTYDKRFEMIMTHPHHDSRIRMALEYKLPEGFVPDSIPIDWDQFKEAVRELSDFGLYH